MSEMIERMAKALFEADQKLSPTTDIMNRLLYGQPIVTWEYVNDQTRVIPSIADEYRNKAKSLLAVMRGPNAGMLIDGSNKLSSKNIAEAERCWFAMIDAAMKDEI